MKVSSDWESHGSSSDKKHVWDEKHVPQNSSPFCVISFHGHFGLSFWLVKSSTRSAHAKPFPAVQSYHRRLVRSGQCPFQHFKQQLLTDFKAVARVTNPLELRAGWLPFLFFLVAAVNAWGMQMAGYLLILLVQRRNWISNATWNWTFDKSWQNHRLPVQTIPLRCQERFAKMQFVPWSKARIDGLWSAHSPWESCGHGYTKSLDETD